VNSILKGPAGDEYKLDLPGATREDVDLLARWLAHVLTPGQLSDGSRIPARLTLEIW
jgi:hypothetical protein